MPRELTLRTSLESLKKEAKHWLKALRAADIEARARLARAHPDAPADPTLRDVQHALALEFGFASWARLSVALAARRGGDSRDMDLQALLAAAEQGDAARVEEVLDRRADIIDERGELQGHTGLRTALHFGIHHESVVKRLLDRGANPNIRDEGDNAMPLHFAAERQNLDIIRLLVEHGADPIGAGDLHELDVIGWATGFDYLTTRRDVVDYLLAHGARHNIFSAVAMGDVDGIRRVVAESRDNLDKPMDRTNHRRRPLHLAIVKRQMASLVALLDLGAGTETRDKAGLTALDQAALAGEAELAQVLVDRGAQIHLPAAIALGRTADIERLISQEPGCLEPGKRWGTLIVRAAERAPGHVIDTLVRLGASIDAWDDPETAVDQTSRFTPLHAAASRGNVSALEALLKHGANPRIREEKYCATPAGWAAYSGHVAARDRILQGPIDIFDAIAFDLTHRIDEIVSGDPQAIGRPFGEYAGCRPDARWWTPLAAAVLQNKADAARRLLALGADPIDAPDGRALHDLAREKGHEQAAQILHEHSVKQHLDAIEPFVWNPPPAPDPDAHLDVFLRLACLTYANWHRLNPDKARRVLADHPEIAQAHISSAAAIGDVETVRAMIESNPALVNAKGGPLHWEPLLYACYSRWDPTDANHSTLAVARLLLSRGADPNAGFLWEGSYAFTALTGAFGRGEDWHNQPPHRDCDALATLLLEAGADPNDSQAIYNRHFEANDDHLKILFACGLGQHKGGPWLTRLGDRSYDPSRMLVVELCAAAQHNFFDRVKLLVQHGVDVNTAGARSRRTPYEDALRAGNHDIAEYLLEHGAKKIELDPLETFALACIAGRREEALARLAEDPTLLDRLGHQGRVDLLHRAVDAKQRDGIRLIVELGVDINGMVPGTGLDRAVLHNAAGWGGLAMVKFLLDLGADPTLRDPTYHGRAIGWAIHGQQRDVVDYLLAFADIFDAVQGDGVERAAALLNEDPSLSNAADEGGNPLVFYMHAQMTRLEEMLALLVAHGANLNARSASGRTLLDRALSLGWTDFAQMLRERGAKTTAELTATSID